jgi:hypothetical protein
MDDIEIRFDGGAPNPRAHDVLAPLTGHATTLAELELPAEVTTAVQRFVAGVQKSAAIRVALGRSRIWRAGTCSTSGGRRAWASRRWPWRFRVRWADR